jgi:predicted DNA-binding transcriptional regulator AlpA
LNKTKRKKGEHFPSPTRLGAMTDSHLEAFFRWINSHSPGETFPLTICRVTHPLRSAIYRAISKLFDIALAMLSGRH